MPLDSNCIFIYNVNEQDSLDIALEYQKIYNLQDYQIVGIDCSATEFLSDRATFKTEVEDNIVDAINTLESSPYNMNIKVVVLGYKVPGGFYDGDDIISSNSRVSRVMHSFSKKEESDIYDLRVYSEYDDTQKEKALITGRIDGPNKQFVLDLLKNSKSLRNQKRMTGRLYIDPYFYPSSIKSDNYYNDIDDFREIMAPHLGLDIISSLYVDPYLDNIFPFIEKDSFFWGGFSTGGSKDFFKKTNTPRCMFYNSDTNDGFYLKDSTKKWPVLAIESGYVSSPMALSDPTPDGFIRPYPFFFTILNRGCIGEAFLKSNPYYDWTMAFIGDPLIEIVLNGQLDEPSGENSFISTEQTVDDYIYNCIRYCSAILAIQEDKKTYLNDMFSTIADSIDVSVIADFFTNTSNLLDKFDPNISNKTVDTLLLFEKFILKYRTVKMFNINNLNDYFNKFNFKISELVKNVLKTKINDEHILDEGYWEINHTLVDETSTLNNYHFILQVSDIDDFSNIIQTYDSESDQSGWFFEYSNNYYKNITSDGVKSNFIGMNIKYKSSSSDYLDRGKKYYFRIKQKDNITDYSYYIYSQVIWT